MEFWEEIQVGNKFENNLRIKIILKIIDLDEIIQDESIDFFEINVCEQQRRGLEKSLL